MKSPFDFDISAAADKKKRRGRSRAQSGAFETSSRGCDHAGCDLPGKYRAPKSPTSVDEYVWFCLDHVRKYNQKWNFFENVDEEAFEEQLKSDTVGGRKTKPMNSEEAKAWARMGFEDPFEVLRSNATSRKNVSAPSRFTANERKALEILEAEKETSKAAIRKIYKSLVKDLHPDRNEGSRADEDRLNEVVWAWEQIKNSRGFSA